jgi:amino acid adenylation domain-containing protein/thioester reductase-like protein
MINASYWKDRLFGAPAVINISSNHQSSTLHILSPRKTYSANFKRILKKATSFSNLHNISIEDMLLSAYYILTYRMTGEKDIVCGKQYGDTLLPIRVSMTGTESFLDLIGVIHRSVSESLEHASTFSKLVVEDTPIQISFSVIPQKNNVILNCGMDLVNSHIYVEYDSSILKDNVMIDIVNHYEKLLSELIYNPNCPIGTINIITKQDESVYSLTNHTRMYFDHSVTATSMFLHTSIKYPDNIALSSDLVTYTYYELNKQINKVANMLLDNNVIKNDYVSILMYRSIDTIIAIMAIMKVGAVYVPLDPDHPRERNLYIIEDTKSKFILSSSILFDKVSDILGKSLGQILYMENCENYGFDEPKHINNPQDIAYIIYTSGSTGNPKGALINHAGIMNLCPSIRDTFNITSKDKLMQFASFSFDASVYELFGAFYCGAHLHLINDEERMSVTAFAKIIEKMQITCIPLIPTVFFNQIASYLPEEYSQKFRSLRILATGGEALTGEAAKTFMNRFGSHLEVINLYGPTECTAVTSFFKINKDVDLPSVVPIGKPYYNYEMYIINEFNKLCPVNVPGEILISSIGVADGYLNQPEKSDQVFILNLFGEKSRKRFYKTGDIARLLPDGNIEYISRKDSQIKVRGFRIEIGEIEDSFAKYSTIQDVAVIPKKGKDGNNELAAFYTTTNARGINSNVLREFLAKRLPKYMIPSNIIYLESIPISPTGKIDRKALSILEIESFEDKNKTIIEPTDDIEKFIIYAWEKVLGLKGISMLDNFFDIGGHSLKILEALVILKPIAPNLKIIDFFKTPVATHLAEKIRKSNQQNTGNNLAENHPNIVYLEENKILDLPDAYYPNERQDHILLTGATGYLGSHILHDLLKTSFANIYCMTRDGNQHRLFEILQNYFGNDIQEYKNRIIMIKGDFQIKEFGMSTKDKEVLSKRINSIIHCGAEVRHYGDLDHFDYVNIGSTRYLLALAQEKNIKFHYISTLGVVEDLAIEGKLNQYLHDPLSSDRITLENVYSNSKFESEKMIYKAITEGVNASIYRMGNLVCNSINGKFQININDNAFYRMLKAMILLRRAPRVNWYVDLTPVDYASSTLVKLIFSDSQPQIFHICNDIQIHYTDIIKGFKKFGYDIELMELNEYSEWLFDQSLKDEEGLRLAILQLEGDGAKDSPFYFSNRLTKESSQNVICPKIDQDFFNKMIDYAISVNYFVHLEAKMSFG